MGRSIKKKGGPKTTEQQYKATENDASGKVKKPFNKAKWREQKYSNKAKLNRFEDRRRKVVLREYYKELKKSGVKNKDCSGTIFTKDGVHKKRKLSPYEMAKQEAERLREEKERKHLERQRIQEERSAALSKYKEKRKDRFIKLSKKTKRGQPLLAGRMELLLEKIQKGC